MARNSSDTTPATAKRAICADSKAALKTRINNGELVEGERVPSEHELARTHGISRNQAREAPIGFAALEKDPASSSQTCRHAGCSSNQSPLKAWKPRYSRAIRVPRRGGKEEIDKVLTTTLHLVTS
jgi:DNA-binding transcriptional MocR family regulator